MREILIELPDGVELNIKGEYLEEERDKDGYVVFPSDFEIESIYSVKSDIFDLLEWATSREKDYLEIIKEKVISKIEDNE